MLRIILRKCRSGVSLFRKTRKMQKDSKKSFFLLLDDYLKLKKRKGIRFDEFFQYEFDKKDENFKKAYLGENEKRAYLDLLNPKKYYVVARNKYFSHLFLENVGIKTHCLYCYYDPEYVGIQGDGKIAYDLNTTLEILRKNNVQECVIKPVEGTHGVGVCLIRSMEYLADDCVMRRYDGDVVKLSEVLSTEAMIFEEIVKQTRQFGDFNPSSVNTVRIVSTLYPDGEVRFASFWLRIGRSGRCVDNAGDGGNINASIDLNDGTIYNSIQFNGWRNIKNIDSHPDTGVQLAGIKVDHWNRIKNEIVKFQQSMPILKAIGWDVAITDMGPVILEINDFWDVTDQLVCIMNKRDEIRKCYLAWKSVEAKREKKLYRFERQNNELSDSVLNKIIRHE